MCTDCKADVVKSSPSNVQMNLIHAVVACGAQLCGLLFICKSDHNSDGMCECIKYVVCPNVHLNVCAHMMSL